MELYLTGCSIKVGRSNIEQIVLDHVHKCRHRHLSLPHKKTQIDMQAGICCEWLSWAGAFKRVGRQKQWW
jgi:hypothetical protein